MRNSAQFSDAELSETLQCGLIVHGTHQSLVEANVFADVRGANLYIEDGNEMYNRVLHNVAICPWAREGAKRGCTVPGTDNGEADTALNQAGLWSLPSINHVVGNRFANHFANNGFLAVPSPLFIVDLLAPPPQQRVRRVIVMLISKRCV